ncbi:MAG: periplasmic heavy metal sensor [Alphaproteobacteria bacterium]|nr:periplasmic heavy metal sensor [Alphaproteobacteria bacterium]NNF24627.1 periplasmic heavy metal sensor [Paracoccaceae bacterium]
MTSDTPGAAGPVTRTALWVKMLLALSLGLNLLIVGIVLGALGRGGLDGRDGDRFQGARELGPLPFVAALEPRDRRALGRALRNQAEPLRQNREMLRARFDALLEALRAETFDRRAVAALIAEQRGLAVDRQEIGERILLDHLASISHGDRMQYADRLDNSLRRDRR